MTIDETLAAAQDGVDKQVGILIDIANSRQASLTDKILAGGINVFATSMFALVYAIREGNKK